MKKFVFAAVAVIAVLAITLCLDAQPAGGGGAGGGRGGAGGGMMGGGGMGAGGGGMMGGGARGGRGMARPDKAARLAAVKNLEKQIADLKAAVDKAPATDPNMAKLVDAELTKFMDIYTTESVAINAIQATIASLRGTGGGRGGATGGPTEEVLNELKTLATGDKATKTAARIDALIKEAQDRAARGGGNRGGRGA